MWIASLSLRPHCWRSSFTGRCELDPRTRFQYGFRHLLRVIGERGIQIVDGGAQLVHNMLGAHSQVLLV